MSDNRQPAGTGRSGRVIVLGSINEDVVAVVDRRPEAGETLMAADGRRSPGGKGANQAVAARRAGGTVALVGAVGADAAGDALLAALAAEDVDLTGVSRLPGVATGTALITVTPDGDNAIVVVPGANGAVGPDAAATAANGLAPGDVLLAQLEIPLATVVSALTAAAGRGARAVLNAAPVRALPRELLAVLDPLVVNGHEAAALLGTDPPDTMEALRHSAFALLGLGATSALVTGGGRGVAWARGADALLVAAEAPAPVVDTTGAGDALCGALVAGLAGGLGDEQALRAAVAFAGVSVTRAGAWPSYPRVGGL